MAEISWDEVRKGDYIVVKQEMPIKGPRKIYTLEWAGQVTEHSQKWTRIKHAKEEMTVPTMYGEVETINRMSKREFDKYVKENYGN